MDMIRERILALADENYRQFHSRLCPNTSNIIGVRLPLLKNLAREIASGDWRAYLASAQNEYYEEILLQGLVIGSAKASIEEILACTADFISKIDNWAVCDSFCASLKITKKNPARVLEFLQPYLTSTNEFELRFAIVMLLDFYITDEYIDQVLLELDKIKHEGYYVKMALAWAISICYIKYAKKTLQYLNHCTLDDFTYNKALQKITESLRVTAEEKIHIRSLKRK